MPLDVLELEALVFLHAGLTEARTDSRACLGAVDALAAAQPLEGVLRDVQLDPPAVTMRYDVCRLLCGHVCPLNLRVGEITKHRVVLET